MSYIHHFSSEVCSTTHNESRADSKQQVTLPLLLPLVSPKFLQKLVYVYTLSDLSEQIPIQQLRVGLDVLVDNGKQEPDGFNDHGGRSRLGQDEDVERGVAAFHVPLEELMPGEGLDQVSSVPGLHHPTQQQPRIPKVLRDCAEHILTTSAIDAQGIFRKSSNVRVRSNNPLDSLTMPHSWSSSDRWHQRTITVYP